MLNASTTESTRGRSGSAERTAPLELETLVEARWYVTYTRANNERRIADQLAERGVENFLAQYESVRKWKDRRVRLQRPLFPGYVFVRLALQNRLQVLSVPGVVRLVGFNGVPAHLPEEEIRILRSGLSRDPGVVPHPFLSVGRRVRISAGPFVGLEGILRRKKSNLRVIVSLELIQRAVAVDVDSADVVPLN
jgi:transcription antitermination factor NusG